MAEKGKETRQQGKKKQQKKSGMSGKMKRNIRYSLAGIFLVSAVAIAAIPSDRSGTAKAATPNPAMNYAIDRELDRNDDIDGEAILNYDPATITDVQSFSITEVGSSFELTQQYKAFMDPAKTSDCIIYGHDVDDTTAVLEVPRSLPTGYKMMKESVFNKYRDEKLPLIDFNVSSANPKATISMNNAAAGEMPLSELKEYYPEKAAEINEAASSEIELVLHGASMGDEGKYRFFCEYRGDGTLGDGSGDISLKGCTLKRVKNRAQGKFKLYNPDTLADEDNYDDYVLAARKVTYSATEDTNDSNGFLLDGSKTVSGIANGAFTGMQGRFIEILKLPDTVTKVGDEAFKGCPLLSSVEMDKVSFIGNRVFQNCISLTSASLAKNTQTIGREAFEGCQRLVTIKFPGNVSEIGFGAFANCISLSSVDFKENIGVNIGEYAFYNTPVLNVTFNMSASYGLGKAAFALPDPQAGMEEFTFPTNLNAYKSVVKDEDEDSYLKGGGYRLYKADDTTHDSSIGDYLLAGRAGLKTVYMSTSYGTMADEHIPRNTFSGCTNLGALELGNQPNNKFLTYDEDLFRDVENHDLYVYGPEYIPSGANPPAYPRECTWRAKTAVEDYVPYKYRTNNEEHYEVGVVNKTDDAGNVTEGYRFDLQTDDAAKTAAIKNCNFIGIVPASIDEFSIPSKVAGYNVTSLNDNCLDNIKDKIVNLIVPDGSLTEIKKEVFYSAGMLESVNIGSSVTAIGESAFANCGLLKSVVIGPNVSEIGVTAFGSSNKLENIYWTGNTATQPDITIGKDAFATGGTKLYFYGDAEEGFKPFDYAMEENVRLYDNAAERICYVYPSPLSYGDAFARGTRVNDVTGDTEIIPSAKSIKDLDDYPHYKIIRDDATGLATLIDYPQFRDLPIEVKKYWLGADDAPASLGPNDLALIDSTVYINVPEAVKSIDVYSYINSNANAGNLHYFSNEGIDGTTLKEVDVYGQVSDNTADGLHSGLFSGYTLETDKLASPKNEDGGTEEETKGNDWVKSISLPGILRIPDYCFDSCERLESLIISKDTTDIGTSAFQGCPKLQTIGTNGNPKYVCDNCILYETTDNGVELNTCLTYRGNGGTPKVINVTTDPMIAKLTSVKEGAFAGCKNIVDVDLRSDQALNAYNGVIDTIPENCFNGCSGLSQVTLPESVRFVGGKAFHDTNDSIKVILPEFASIESDAFDDGEARIYSYWDDKEKGTIKNQAYGKAHNIDVFPLEGASRITLKLDDEYTVYRTITVGSPTETVSLPGASEMAEIDSKLYAGQGYVFKCWRYIASDGKIYYSDTDTKFMTENIDQDRTYIAVFIKPSDYTVTYYDQFGDVYDQFEIAAGKTIGNRKPTAPEGYYWVYTYPTGFDDTKPVNSNVTAMAYPDPDYVKPSGGEVATPTPDPDATIVPTLEPETTATPIPEPTRDPANTPTPVPGTQTPTPTPIGYVATPTPIGPVTGGYLVTVENGAGGGYFKAGSVVTITAYSPAAGQQFDRWTTSNTDIGFSNVNAVSTTFIMPSHDVKVTATYKKQTTSGNATPASSQYNNNGTGTGTRKPQDKGSTDVIITTDTIDNNNKNRGTATVAGSTDNFVLKITDSAAASAAVEQALRNMYGERFANINYAAFDISLYDSTGTNLISNANDLAVTVTIPIPDALTQYAGNNRAGAVVNGQLQELSVKFVSLDGVPCMRFTATHFSPYTIFVDTQNVVRGISDTTPKTGDGIAPKWFLSAGMLSLSAILFLWRDKKPEIAKAVDDRKRKRK
ncbi:MAG: leucine-rich repeat protein [Lachnospiraceae bacterium]|nr:leucine-rich repeat protein [Lachnospiraceae bacterium]